MAHCLLSQLMGVEYRLHGNHGLSLCVGTDDGGGRKQRRRIGITLYCLGHPHDFHARAAEHPGVHWYAKFGRERSGRPR